MFTTAKIKCSALNHKSKFLLLPIFFRRGQWQLNECTKWGFVQLLTCETGMTLNLVPSGTCNNSLSALATLPTHRTYTPRPRNSSGLCIIESRLHQIKAYTNRYVYDIFCCCRQVSSSLHPYLKDSTKRPLQEQPPHPEGSLQLKYL